MKGLRIAVLSVVCLALPVVHLAGGLTKGENEVAFRVNYSDIDFGSAQGFDLGGTTNTAAGLLYGWLLTDTHEVGVSASYTNQELDGGAFLPDVEIDGTSMGLFYQFNFKTAGTITPFAGVNAAVLGGDIGDAYDLRYGAEAGIKLYPFDHGGVGVSVDYGKLKADPDGLPDADGLGFGAALLLKY